MDPAKISERIKALFIDYLIILGYAIALLVINISIHFIVFGGLREGAHINSHILSFITLILPVFIYFFITESRGRYASVGKRLAKIHVVYKKNDGFSCFIRNGLKLLPWQLAHMGVIEGAYNNFDSLFVMAVLVLSIILPIGYIIMFLFRKDHRHLPDLLAGSIVVRD